MDLGKIEDGGGYDLSELAQAKESLDGNPNPEKEFIEVDPILVVVSDNPVVRTEELEARVVVVDYDENDEVVSIEVL
ncbi:MAG: hypothetical protein DRH89_07330 [Candidatus Cloacimonadota bacterium]|jgi:uncharacterized protein YuzE|nr:MAG: hypothetical protein DRH89_07330 [Candidatus Cloacimonadota bacterium]